ncbi:F-box only protein 6-like [Protopterus annectens]|uniref:F-box only protein 6-like n=1 Tax=Protopterus annectens TaxID=7888 RepID=UPI001CFB3D9D|nr:F-box only protein 6-like [Protopterus annectens]XP_043917713.1 F-box only protein 6-like [Protopterus annectens]
MESWTYRIPLIPNDAVTYILLYVPAAELLAVHRLVCRQWKEIIDGPTLWKKKCQWEGFIPKTIRRSPKSWKVFYVLSSLKRNLIRNPSAEENLDGWKIISNGGDKWRIEDLPGDHGTPHPEEHVNKYFVTSFGKCEKEQIIDLNAEGYCSELLDNINPAIVVTDWYAARRDCGSKYNILVQLLSGSLEVLHEFCPKTVVIEQWSDACWRKMTHTFKNYGHGVRYVRFNHAGEDTQFWKGWYGIRVTNSSVVVEPETLTVVSEGTKVVLPCQEA